MHNATTIKIANYKMRQTEDTGKQTKLKVPWNALSSHEDMYPASYSISTKQSQPIQTRTSDQHTVFSKIIS